MRTDSRMVICVGELLIDFFCTDIGVELSEGVHFHKQAGGAPANVAAAIAKLGGQAAFAGKVGNDPFGSFLRETLADLGVDTSMLVMSEDAATTLAFVSLQADGERDFTFVRGADRLLELEELDQAKMNQAKVVHFGSATALLDDPLRTVYFTLMANAKASGQFVSFDPNYRSFLWQNRVDEFLTLARRGIGLADFVKVSETELQLISGVRELAEGVGRLHELGGRMIAVTLGKAGTFLSDGKRQGLISSIPVTAVDSTGAGDAFVGAVLFRLANLAADELAAIHYDLLADMIAFGNKVGAMVCTQVGAIGALPAYEDVLRFG